MRTKRSIKGAALLLLTSILLASSPRVSAEIAGSFKDLHFGSEIGEGGKLIWKILEGTGTLKNEKGEIVAEGKVEYKEGYIALRGKKGASFEYQPQATKVTSTRWTEKKPSQFATISLDKQNRWLLTDSNFFFLTTMDPVGPSTFQILLPESTVRSSIITLPSGTFELFGYKIKAHKDGAKVKFFHGIVVESSDCTIADLKVNEDKH